MAHRRHDQGGTHPRLNARQQQLLARIAEVYRSAGFSPPSRWEASQALGIPPHALDSMIALALELGELVAAPGGVMFHAEAVADAQRIAIEAITAQGDLSPARFRDLIGTSRKYAIPLLEHLDAMGITRRDGARRVLAEAQADAAAEGRQCPT